MHEIVHHHILPHAGEEMTMKEVSKIMMVINNPRKVIQAIRHSCPACRLIHKKTVELRMMPHPDARTILAPPFHIAQVDTVFGFRAQVFKNARKTVKIYALIICCLLALYVIFIHLRYISLRKKKSRISIWIH